MQFIYSILVSENVDQAIIQQIQAIEKEVRFFLCPLSHKISIFCHCIDFAFIGIFQFLNLVLCCVLEMYRPCPEQNTTKAVISMGKRSYVCDRIANKILTCKCIDQAKKQRKELYGAGKITFISRFVQIRKLP